MVAELETNILVEMLEEATTFANDVDLFYISKRKPVVDAADSRLPSLKH